MIEITDTRNVKVYVAAKEVSRIHERNYEGGGSVVVCCDGTRVETYSPASELRAAVEAEIP